ncbi:MAG: bacteriohemerythrin [Alphaproteobacteria bacterium]
MSFCVWNTSMSVGDRFIDGDHKGLIHLINRLHENAGVEGQYDKIREIVDRLIDYTAFHFSREEQLMRVCDYPALSEHKGAHDRFTARIHDFRKSLHPAISESKATALAEYLKEWLTNHILVEDAAYKKSIKDNAETGRVSALFGSGLIDRVRNLDSDWRRR